MKGCEKHVVSRAGRYPLIFLIETVTLFFKDDRIIIYLLLETKRVSYLSIKLPSSLSETIL